MTRHLRLAWHVAISAAVLVSTIHAAADTVTAPVAAPVETPAPTAAPQIITGRATHYDASRNNAWYTRGDHPYIFYAAAGKALRKVRDFRWGADPYRIIITSPLTGRSVVATVVDWCGCYGQRTVDGDERLVDLAPAIWEALGVPLLRGVMKVEVEILP